MRPSWCLTLTWFFVLLSVQLVYALPAESGTGDASTSHSRSNATSSDTSPSVSSSTARPAAHSTTVAHTSSSGNHTRSPDVDGTETSRSTSPTNPIVILSPTHPIHSTHHTWNHTGSNPTTHHFPPPSISPTAPAVQRPPTSSHGQSAVAIVFEVIAGAALLLILIALGRCYWSYRRTPGRDRISALVSRHQLEREMEEAERTRMERFSRAMESRRWRPPPPPYQSAPAYETVVGPDGSIDWGHPPTYPSPSPPP